MIERTVRSVHASAHDMRPICTTFQKRNYTAASYHAHAQTYRYIQMDVHMQGRRLANLSLKADPAVTCPFANKPKINLNGSITAVIGKYLRPGCVHKVKPLI